MPDGPGGWGLPAGYEHQNSGGGFSGVLQEFHIPWPACNQDAARQAADAWRTLAATVEDVSIQCTALVASIAENNSGQAVDAFAAYWQKFGGKSGMLPLSAEACLAVATACDTLADKVSEVKTEIEHKAEELAAMALAAVVALVFTWGASVAVTSVVAENVVAWVTGLIEDLAANVGYVSQELAEDIGFFAAPAGAVAGSAVTGVGMGLSGGTFTEVFDEVFQGSLDVLNGEPLPSAKESVDDVLKDAKSGVMLGILTEATPAIAEELTSDETAGQIFSVSPQLALMLSDSSKLAAWLDTAAGKAFIEGGGITALKKQGMLDETTAEGKVVEALLDGALSKINPGMG